MEHVRCHKTIAVLGDVRVGGEVQFHQCYGCRSTQITISFWGLGAHKQHAIHIHEFGDLRGGCETLGGHWNPTGETHGSRDHRNLPRHSGDLINNMRADSQGKFHYTYMDERVKVTSVIGRSVVVHVGVDDLGLGGHKDSLVTGHAGKRLMCGIIGRLP
jgi:Cu-Zn family superoxide dismutase